MEINGDAVEVGGESASDRSVSARRAPIVIMAAGMDGHSVRLLSSAELYSNPLAPDNHEVEDHRSALQWVPIAVSNIVNN